MPCNRNTSIIHMGVVQCFSGIHCRRMAEFSNGRGILRIIHCYILASEDANVHQTESGWKLE